MSSHPPLAKPVDSTEPSKHFAAGRSDVVLLPFRVDFARLRSDQVVSTPFAEWGERDLQLRPLLGHGRLE